MAEQHPFAAAERRHGRFPPAGETHQAAIRSSWHPNATAGAIRKKHRGPEAKESSQRAQRLLAEARSFKASHQRSQAVATAAASADPLPLHTAAKDNELEDLRRLLAVHGRAGAMSLLKVRSANGQTALHYASRRGNAEAASILLRAGAAVDAQEDGGWTPLMLAAKRGHLDAAEVLLDFSPSLELRTAAGLTALGLACMQEHTSVAAAVLRAGADPSSTDNDDWTPVHTAAKKGMAEILKAFLCTERGRAAAGAATKRDGDTPLHLCCRRGHGASLVPLLLKCESADPNRHNFAQGQVPLHCASNNGDICAVNALLGHSADPTRADRDGETPLHAAARQGHYAIVGALLRAGASPSAVAACGDTALHLASRDGRIESMEQLLCTQRLRGMGFALSAIKNSSKRTALDEARRCRETVAAQLLEYWDEASHLTASLQRLAFASLSHHRLSSETAIGGSGLPWSLIRPRGQQKQAGIDTPLQRRGAKLELHLWVLDFLSHVASGDVVGRATGVAQRCARAQQAAVTRNASGWGMASTSGYLGEHSVSGRACPSGATGVQQKCGGTDHTNSNGSSAFSTALVVEWAWREIQLRSAPGNAGLVY